MLLYFMQMMIAYVGVIHPNLIHEERSKHLYVKGYIPMQVLLNMCMQ